MKTLRCRAFSGLLQCPAASAESLSDSGERGTQVVGANRRSRSAALQREPVS